MKRKLIAVVSILILAATTISYSSGLSATLASYPININNQRLEATPLNVNGTTYLPVRSVSEALGVDIGWTGKSVEINTVDVDKLKESCTMIFAENSTVGSQGSAVCWDYGEYLTAYHIVDNGQTNIRTADDENLTVDQTDKEIDIATLKSLDNVQPVKIGDSSEVSVGDRVLLISSPDGKENVATWGRVKNLNAEIVVTGVSSGGSSGGALFNDKGELIGILVAGDTGLKECYIKRINAIRQTF